MYYDFLIILCIFWFKGSYHLVVLLYASCSFVQFYNMLINVSCCQLSSVKIPLWYYVIDWCARPGDGRRSRDNDWKWCGISVFLFLVQRNCIATLRQFWTRSRQNDRWRFAYLFTERESFHSIRTSHLP